MKKEKDQKAINEIIAYCERRIKESGIQIGYYQKIIEMLEGNPLT